MAAGCGGSGGELAPQPGVTPASPARHCLDVRAATDVWRDVNRRINAVTLSPTHGGLDGAATGTAAAVLRQYIGVELVAKKLTEREEDRLDSLTVSDGACAGGPLVVEVRETLVKDDYLAGDGHVDHTDAKVGTQSHLEKTFTQVGTAWKLTDLRDLDAPGPTTPPTVV